MRVGVQEWCRRVERALCAVSARLCCRASAALAAAVLVVGSEVPAAEYAVNTAITGRVEYSDNLSLRVDKNPGWHFTVSPSVSFARNTESNQVAATASLGFNSYTDKTVDEQTDRALGLRLRQAFERSEIGLQAGYKRETTALGQAALSGISLGTQYTDRYNVAPTFSYSLTDRTTLLAGGGYDFTRYQRVNASSYDETTKSASLGFSYALTPRASAGLRLGYFKFDTNPVTSTSDSWSVSATGSYALSERSNLTASVGVQRTRQTATENVLTCPIDPIFCELGLIAPVPLALRGETRSTNYPFDLGYKWAMSERESISLTASNAVGQFGTGATSVQTAVGAGYSNDLTERLNLAVSLAWTQSRALSRESFDRQLTLAPSLAYKLGDAWTAGCGYIYYRNSYKGADQTVEANSVFATLTYNWPLYQQPR